MKSMTTFVGSENIAADDFQIHPRPAFQAVTRGVPIYWMSRGY
jgi:hypothetical protein